MLTEEAKQAISEAQHRGSILLNRHFWDWRDCIDPTILDMATSSSCILGQLYGSYDAGLAALDLPSGTNYGFNVPFEAEGDLGELFSYLREVWIGEMNAN